MSTAVETGLTIECSVCRSGLDAKFIPNNLLRGNAWLLTVAPCQHCLIEAANAAEDGDQ
jgi:hypothetical protein